MTPEQAALGAARIIDRCHTLARHSEAPDAITRPFLCRSAHPVQQHVQTWMEQAGLRTRIDGLGNVRGESASPSPAVPRLLLGSHLDTVPNAGAFDGILGVVLAIEAVQSRRDTPLPYALDVIAFSDEEGVRFGRPFLGSLAVVGRTQELLAWTDQDGVSVVQAIEAFGIDLAAPTGLAPGTAGYLEVHIEQGPVLESLGQSLAVVDAIAGQSRYTLHFHGHSNHAGTTPMPLRQDALAAAAEWIVAVEQHARACPDLVATVGRIEARPGAGNVIPGHVTASLDVRHRHDDIRRAAAQLLLQQAEQSAHRRSVTVTVHPGLDQPATPMDPVLRSTLHRAAEAATGRTPPTLTSGAGHDAMVLAQHVPSAMLFVRSPAGLSHHPDETVLPGDVADALATVVHLLEIYGKQPAQPR